VVYYGEYETVPAGSLLEADGIVQYENSETLQRQQSHQEKGEIYGVKNTQNAQPKSSEWRAGPEAKREVRR
jgi:hypothetical protein